MANKINYGGTVGQTSNPPADLGGPDETPNVTVHPHAVQKIVEETPVDTSNSVNYDGLIEEQQQE